MTVKELKDILTTYPDNQFIYLRIWLDPNKDYLDEGLVQVMASKALQGISGAVVLTGSVPPVGASLIPK